jgi:putative aldouronate transport system permease protein
MVFQNPDIIVGYLNTIFRTVVGTALHVFLVCLTAYPLARKELPHRSLLIFLVLFTMIFNGGLVPMFLVINGVGLYNSRWVYIVPLLLTAFNVIIVKNFFQQVPESYAESARIDGASEFRIMWDIFLPLSKPVLATITLWTAVIHWNHWFDALLYIDDNNKQVMQILLRRIVIENSVELIEKGLVNPDVAQFTPETIKAATTIITILPILIFYPFVQKYFVKGIMIGGIKG